MSSGNIILVVIVTLIVSAVTDTVKRKITTDSYTYDPDSIVQNEKILRLFLRLASETANRLIRLKNEVKHRQESRPRGEKNEPSLRIDLAENLESTFVNRGGLERQERPIYSHENESTDSYKPTERDSLKIRCNQKSNNLPNTQSQRENDREEVPPSLKPENVTDSKNSSAKSDNEGKSVSPKFEKESAETKLTEDIGNANSTDPPVEVENRMMINVEKTNYVSHYNEHSQTISNADTRITSVESPQGKETNVPQMGSVIPGFSGFHGNPYGHLNPEITKGNTDPGSTLSSNDAATLKGDSMIDASNNHTGSSKILNPNQYLTSNVSDTTKTPEIDNQELKVASNIQTGSNEITRESQQSTLSGDSGNVTGKVNQDMSTNPDLNSGTTRQGNQTITYFDANQKNDMSGFLNPDKLNVDLSTNHTSILTNQRPSSSFNPNQKVSAIANLGNSTSGELWNLVQNTEPKILVNINDPVLSSAQKSIGQARKSLSGFNESGSRYAGSLILEKGTGMMSDVGTNFQRSNPATPLRGSNVSAIRQIGSRLLGNLPLFRAFPDADDQFDNLVNNSSNTYPNATKEYLNVTIDQSPFNQTTVNGDPLIVKYGTLMYADNSRNQSDIQSPLFQNKLDKYEEIEESGLSDLDLKDFANKFADALRPIESGQKIEEHSVLP